MVNVSFGIIHLVVSSRDRNDEGFDIEKFLFGEGSRSSAGEADVSFLVQFPHLFLSEEVIDVDVFLGEEGFEIIVEFSQGDVEGEGGGDEGIGLKELSEGFVEGARALGACGEEYGGNAPCVPLQKGDYFIT